MTLLGPSNFWTSDRSRSSLSAPAVARDVHSGTALVRHTRLARPRATTCINLAGTAPPLLQRAYLKAMGEDGAGPSRSGYLAAWIGKTATNIGAEPYVGAASGIGAHVVAIGFVEVDIAVRGLGRGACP